MIAILKALTYGGIGASLALAVGGSPQRGAALSTITLFWLSWMRLPKKVDEVPLGGIVISGASSGIGKAAAIELARLGFTVFAGVRRKQDGLDLSEKGCVPILLDVTSDTSVSAAVQKVRAIIAEKRIPLVGIVNNAGVIDSGIPLELRSQEDHDFVFSVNLFGCVRLTKHFVPVIRETSSTGRVVNIGSILGLLHLPGNADYCMSKAAVEALTSVSRGELAPFNIHVSVLNPGYVRTELIAKAEERQRATFEQLAQAHPKEMQKLYPHAFDKQVFEKRMRATLLGFSTCPPPATSTTPAIVHALTSTRPKSEYIVGSLNLKGGFPSAELAAFFTWLLPSPVRLAWITSMTSHSKKRLFKEED